jgi:hypothetical protein
MKDELKSLVQYLCLALLAGWLYFVFDFGSIPNVNVREAWLNYKPLLRGWLTIFAVLGAVRLLLVFALRKFTARRRS